MNIIDRVMLFIESENIPVSAFEKKAGLGNGYISKIKRSPSQEKCEDILSAFPKLNPSWLLRGEGEMYINVVSEEEVEECAHELVPLLPISAQGGSLNDFVVSLNGNGYEKIISPIKGALRSL